MDAALGMLSYVGWVLLAIMILVFVHELGHFLFAKLFGMRVDRFSIGFPPKVVGKKVGDTEYVIGLTPLGGYVKIAGMIDESMDESFTASEPQPWEFRSKPVWQRSLVIVAGVVFNMILAGVIYVSLKAAYGEVTLPAVGSVRIEDGSIAYGMGLRTGDRVVEVNGRPAERTGGLSRLEETLLVDRLEVSVLRGADTLSLSGPADLFTQLSRSEGRFGIAYDPPVVGDTGEDTPARAAGLRRGDWILALDGDTVSFWSDISDRIGTGDGSPVLVRIFRPDTTVAIAGAGPVAPPGPGSTMEVTVTPRDNGGRYQLGVLPYYEIREFSVLSAVPAGLRETWTQTRVIATSLKRVFTGQENFRENVGGPIAIAKITKEAADQGAAFFWQIVAMLSITLAIINILPIPALDGGHLVFLIYEGIARREPSVKVRMALQQVGMFLLLGFMAFVILNDILKL